MSSTDKMTLSEKLKSEVMNVTWDALAPHHKREAVFLIDQSLDIVEVGKAIAEDNTSLIKIYLDEKKLINTNDMDFESLSEDSFDFLILTPYVLIKKK